MTSSDNNRPGEVERNALILARSLIATLAQTSGNVWYVSADDPETAVIDTTRAIDAALATTGFIEHIHSRTPNGEWIAVQHHPNGDWSVAEGATITGAALIRQMAVEVAAGFVSMDYPDERDIRIAEAGIRAALTQQEKTDAE